MAFRTLGETGETGDLQDAGLHEVRQVAFRTLGETGETGGLQDAG